MHEEHEKSVIGTGVKVAEVFGVKIGMTSTVFCTLGSGAFFLKSDSRNV